MAFMLELTCPACCTMCGVSHVFCRRNDPARSLLNKHTTLHIFCFVAVEFLFVSAQALLPAITFLPLQVPFYCNLEFRDVSTLMLLTLSAMGSQTSAFDELVRAKFSFRHANIAIIVAVLKCWHFGCSGEGFLIVWERPAKNTQNSRLRGALAPVRPWFCALQIAKP